MATCGDESVSIWLRTDDEILAAFRKVEAGRSLKPETWPNRARVAVALSVDVDNQSAEVVEGKGPAFVSLGHYGARRGLERLIDVFDRHCVPATFFMPAMSLMSEPGMAQAIARAGHHEIGLHGWVHELPTDLTKSQHRKLLTKSADCLERLTGTRPVGYRAPAAVVAEHTYPLLKELGLLYSSSLLSDDVPFEVNLDGAPDGMIEIPMCFGLEDSQLATPFSGFANAFPPSEVLKIFKDEFDIAYEEGTCAVMVLHPHVSGQRSRIGVIDAFLAHMASKPDVWFATHQKLAECARQQL